jgi:hypothetical protein
MSGGKMTFQPPQLVFGSALGLTAVRFFGRLSVRRGSCSEAAYEAAYQNEHGIQFGQVLSGLGSYLCVKREVVSK